MIQQPSDNQDKIAWCAYGEALEKEFLTLSWSAGIGVFRNPAKERDKYAHDMFGVFPVDLKTITKPFETVGTYGFNPDYAVTINNKDLDRYEKTAPTLIVFFDIRFPKYQAIHMAQLGRLLKLKEAGKARQHFYQDRVEDTSGNAKSSWIYDCRWFPILPNSKKKI
jgi:hypothetical protein